MNNSREKEIKELQKYQSHFLPQSGSSPSIINQKYFTSREPSTYFNER